MSANEDARAAARLACASASTKMTIEEFASSCARPYAEVIVARARRARGARATPRDAKDVARAIEALTTTMNAMPLEMRTRGVEREVEKTFVVLKRAIEDGAGRGEAFASGDGGANAFESAEAMNSREATRGEYIDEVCASVLSSLTPEENWRSVIGPKLLSRAYEILRERERVDDDEVERMVRARYDKWVEMWRTHCDEQKREVGRTPSTADFRVHLKAFLKLRLPAFASGIHKASFEKREFHASEEEDLLRRDGDGDERAVLSTSSLGEARGEGTLHDAIAALRGAETASDARALLTAAWVRAVLVDAPKFALPKRKNGNGEGLDVGAQMMKDWQREESILVRWSTRPMRGAVNDSQPTANVGWENLGEDLWREEQASTGPFRVHFMRACGVVESALRECKTCDYHNVTEDDKRGACAKGAARIMLVASRTMRSGDGLEFCHELFGAPPQFSVIAVDPSQTKSLLDSAAAPAPIVVEISPDVVQVKCLDIFKVFRHTIAHDAEDDAESIEHESIIAPWCAIALVTTQTLRVADSGELKLVKQRIALDLSIPQPELDRFFPIDRELARDVDSRAFSGAVQVVVQPLVASS